MTGSDPRGLTATTAVRPFSILPIAALFRSTISVAFSTDRPKKRHPFLLGRRQAVAAGNCPAAPLDGSMTPKRHGRSDTGFQPGLANHRHNAFYGSCWSHSHDASEPVLPCCHDPRVPGYAARTRNYPGVQRPGFGRPTAPTPAVAPRPLPRRGYRRLSCTAQERKFTPKPRKRIHPQGKCAPA